MRPIDAEELGRALQWYQRLDANDRYIIRRAMRSVDSCGVDGTWVLIAAFRLNNRVMVATQRGWWGE